ncbi:Os01g0941901 [Oryza sativa Japonica Group]|uniref:Os01g0941901 protein n=1 Tax=Oryza sativa subsp. japonica TaxID=39947 RepID=A0A0P0VCP3_ORYSJ|nr:Os01g0941901 [Oryza sativa Japonica Group]
MDSPIWSRSLATFLLPDEVMGGSGNALPVTASSRDRPHSSSTVTSQPWEDPMMRVTGAAPPSLGMRTIRSRVRRRGQSSMPLLHWSSLTLYGRLGCSSVRRRVVFRARRHGRQTAEHTTLSRGPAQRAMSSSASGGRSEKQTGAMVFGGADV